MPTQLLKREFLLKSMAKLTQAMKEQRVDYC